MLLSVIDNCIFKSKTLSGRTFIGSEIDNCKNLSSLYSIMPFKKVGLISEAFLLIISSAFIEPILLHHACMTSVAWITIFRFRTLYLELSPKWPDLGLWKANGESLPSMSSKHHAQWKCNRLNDSGFTFSTKKKQHNHCAKILPWYWMERN